MWIDGTELHINGDEDTQLTLIKDYLHKNKILIFDSQMGYLEVEEVMKILKLNPEHNFSSVSINTLEEESINEIKLYSKKVNTYINGLDSLSEVETIDAFVNLINSLLELKKLSNYYNVDFYTEETINGLASQAISQYEKGDVEYIKGMILYEIGPAINEFKTKVVERKSN